jgi:hypothetical protein
MAARVVTLTVTACLPPGGISAVSTFLDESYPELNAVGMSERDMSTFTFI